MTGRVYQNLREVLVRLMLRRLVVQELGRMQEELEAVLEIGIRLVFLLLKISPVRSGYHRLIDRS